MISQTAIALLENTAGPWLLSLELEVVIAGQAPSMPMIEIRASKHRPQHGEAALRTYGAICPQARAKIALGDCHHTRTCYVFTLKLIELNHLNQLQVERHMFVDCTVV